MAGYVYRGEIHDSKPAEIEHGTRRGYQAHKYRKEEACDPCKAANTAYTTGWERRTHGRTKYLGFTVEKCGTQAGYAAHTYHGIPKCGPCLEANRAYHRAYKAAKKASA